MKAERPPQQEGAKRVWPAVVLLAILLMALLQWVLHELFMKLPMLQYHLIAAVLTAAVLSVAAVLYVKWRQTAVTAHEALCQLRALETLRDDLMAMLVHDLKNPLTSSLMASKMLLTRSSNLPQGERDLLDMAIRSQVRLVSMIEDLLDVARAEQGKMPMTLSDVDLATVIDEALSEAAFPAEQAGVHLCATTGPCAPVPADAEKLHRVVANLVGNAIKFTPRDGSVAVTLSCMDSEATVSVHDTGLGLPAGSHERIFDKFMQVSADGPRLSVGLGLTFCKYAIEAHGGRIWVDSVPGEGSTFSFSLPLAAKPTPGGVQSFHVGRDLGAVVRR